MPRTVIQVYDPSTVSTEVFDLDLPSYVTITGREDHFEFANRDASLIAKGMKEILHRLQDNGATDEPIQPAKRPHIRIKSIIMD